MPPAHQMQVHVKDGLSAVIAGVHEDAVAALVHLVSGSQFFGFEHHAAEQPGILV